MKGGERHKREEPGLESWRRVQGMQHPQGLVKGEKDGKGCRGWRAEGSYYTCRLNADNGKLKASIRIISE